MIRRFPPAVFPVLFGSFGLALVWRELGALGLAPPIVGQLLAWAAGLLYAAALAAYLAKLALRPSVVREELLRLPGRAGLSTAALSLLLLAGLLAEADHHLAAGLYFTGLAAQTLVAALTVHALRAPTVDIRRVTPVWHLTFVGYVLGILPALALGYPWLAVALFVFCGLAAAAIVLATLDLFVSSDSPAALRPTQAIHLAPASLLGTAALGLGNPALATALAGVALVIGAALLARLRWLLAAGFTPLWGAFTFPTAAFTVLMLRIGASEGIEAAFWLGLAGAAAVSLLIPWIAARVLARVPSGQLAEATGAATA